MALPVDPTRYIVMLSIDGGWPDETLVPRPNAMERELRAIFGVDISMQAARRGQNPGANVTRYYELEAAPALTPTELKDMRVVAIERIGADLFSDEEIHVALTTGEGIVVEGTAKPQPR